MTPTHRAAFGAGRGVMAARIGFGNDIGLVTLGDEHSWATFSPCMRYRYVLARLWDKYYSDDPFDTPRSLLRAVCLNPSKATHEVPDPTLKKLCYYAKRDGFGGLLLGNAFALRSTDPRELLEAYKRGEDPVGPQNDEALLWILRSYFGQSVGGWGTPKWRVLKHRLTSVRLLGQAPGRWWCFGRCADGNPMHPLYLRNDAPLVELYPRDAA